MRSHALKLQESGRTLLYEVGSEWQLNCSRQVSAFVITDVSIQRKLPWLQEVIDTNPLLVLAIKPLLLVVTCTCGLEWLMDYREYTIVLRRERSYHQ